MSSWRRAPETTLISRRREPPLRALLPGLLLTMLGCDPAPIHELPARVADPTPEGHAEISRIVSLALGGVPVTIAEDALTQSSLLLIERALPRDPGRAPIGGRVLDMPEQFRLLLVGAECRLRHMGSGRHWTLSVVQCRPEAD